MSSREAIRGPVEARGSSRRPEVLRRSIAIKVWLLPGGGEVLAPSIGDPRWRGPDRAPLSLSDVIAGQSEHVRVELLAAHTEAIARIVNRAAAAKAAGEPSARASVAAASRLLHEIIGHG